MTNTAYTVHHDYEGFYLVDTDGNPVVVNDAAPGCVPLMRYVSDRTFAGLKAMAARHGIEVTR